MSIFDNHTSQESIEDFAKELKWQERLRTLVGFETSDGKKHLGYFSPVVNPCGDYRDSDSYIEQYVDEYGTEYRDVTKVIPIEVVDIYYWYSESGEYKLLPSPQKASLQERMRGLFAKDLITNDKDLRFCIFGNDSGVASS